MTGKSGSCFSEKSAPVGQTGADRSMFVTYPRLLSRIGGVPIAPNRRHQRERRRGSKNRNYNGDLSIHGRFLSTSLASEFDRRFVDDCGLASITSFFSSNHLHVFLTFDRILVLMRISKAPDFNQCRIFKLAQRNHAESGKSWPV